MDLNSPMSMPDAEFRCEDCGAIVPEAAAGGLCVACLLGAVVEPIDANAGQLDEATVDGMPMVEGYRFLKRLGAGGEGEVWLAEGGGDLKRKVALKLLQQGRDQEDMVARFETERSALALMEHPGIAQVYDAGVAFDGRPYVAMEYIDGLPLTEFARTLQLPLLERLSLFEQVCRAVLHAHQKGIIHRDLKPSNLLATRQADGDRVVVIDFGIARAIERPVALAELYTRTGQVLGTPAYMSPEQLGEGGVDTRTDVYALGVVLYEILTDTLPFNPKDLNASGIAEWVRIIQKLEPVKPSVRSGCPELRRELDWVAAKCLEKDADQRYQSPGILADEISRFLNNEPVETGPPTATYQIQKFVRRHKVGVLAGVLIFVVTLCAAIVSIVFGIKARQAERLSDKRATQGEAMVSFLLGGLYEDLEPTGHVGALRSAAQQVEEYYSGLPEASDPEALAHRALALVNVSRVDRSSHDAVDRALALYRSIPDTPALDIAEALLEKALIYRRGKQGPELLATSDKALAQLESAPDSPAVHHLRAKILLAKARAHAFAPIIADRDYESAIGCQRLAETEAVAAGAIATDQLIEARLSLALDLLQLGRSKEAGPYAMQAHALAKEQFASQPNDVRFVHRYAQTEETLGAMAYVGKRWQEALQRVDQARGRREMLWRLDPTNDDYRHRLGKNLRLLAQVLHANGDDIYARERIQLAVLLEGDYVSPGFDSLPMETAPDGRFFTDGDTLPSDQKHAFIEGSIRGMAGAPSIAFDGVWRLEGDRAKLTIELEKPTRLQALTIDHFAGEVLGYHTLVSTLTVQFSDSSTEEHPFYIRDTSIPAVDSLFEGSMLAPDNLKLSRCSVFSQTWAIENNAIPVESLTISYQNATPASALYVVGFRGRLQTN